MCDLGQSNAEDAACTPSCEDNVCGDGMQGPAEGCDDGNLEAGDGCGPACALESCGDGAVNPGEDCDDGQNGDPDDGCTDACLLPACGDGWVQPSEGESCDDSNGDNTDACTDTCQAAACGDGFLQRGESCDDGNADNTDACTNACEEATCGDGFVQAGEACDDGNGSNTDNCTNMCQAAVCGDGFNQPGEGCDDGNNNTHDACTNSCETYCSQTSGWNSTWSSLEAQVRTRVNQARSTPTNCGSAGQFPAAPALAMNGALRCAARNHSRSMANQETIAHNLYGDNVGDRISYTSYDPSTYGENVGGGTAFPSAQSIVNGWLGSPSHCANLMNANFDHIGVGYVRANGTDHVHFWTQVFGAQ
jgi:cysteine-rich repeat protein